MLRIPVLTAGALLAAGCATLDYVGESYAPTTSVDLYFKESDSVEQVRIEGLEIRALFIRYKE